VTDQNFKLRMSSQEYTEIASSESIQVDMLDLHKKY